MYESKISTYRALVRNLATDVRAGKDAEGSLKSALRIAREEVKRLLNAERKCRIDSRMWSLEAEICRIYDRAQCLYKIEYRRGARKLAKEGWKQAMVDVASLRDEVAQLMAKKNKIQDARA